MPLAILYQLSAIRCKQEFGEVFDLAKFLFVYILLTFLKNII